MSERVFYPDTDDVSSTSKVVALSIARNRTRELILSGSTVQRFHASTNPWHAIALATAARGDSQIIRRRGFFRSTANILNGILSLGVIKIDMPKSSAAGKKSPPRHPRRKTTVVKEDEQLHLVNKLGNGRTDQVLLPYKPLPKAFFSSRIPDPLPQSFIYRGSCENFLWHAKRQQQKFDLIFTSPPYNLGKPYTNYSDNRDLDEYLEWQEGIIADCIECLEEKGSLCWQVGNYVSNGLVVSYSRNLQ